MDRRKHESNSAAAIFLHGVKIERKDEREVSGVANVLSEVTSFNGLCLSGVSEAVSGLSSLTIATLSFVIGYSS